MSPRTTCLYSAASIFDRSWFAASHNAASTDLVVPFDFFVRGGTTTSLVDSLAGPDFHSRCSPIDSRARRSALARRRRTHTGGHGPWPCPPSRAPRYQPFPRVLPASDF